MKVGFIGIGRMAAPMVRALAGGGHELHLSPRNAESARALALECPGATVHDANQGVVDAADVVLVCLLAETAWAVLPQLRFRAEQEVISVMADASVARLGECVAPASRVCSTIPMPFIDHGGCPLPVFPRSPALEVLFGADNEVITLPSEQALAPHWAVAGSMAGMLEQLAGISRWLSEHTGDSGGAERYVAALYGGFLGALPKDGQGRLRSAIESVSTEGGLNAGFRDALVAADVPVVVAHALDRLFARIDPGRHDPEGR